MIPLASTGVKASGKAAGVIAAQFEVPVEVLGYLASETFDQIAITKVATKQFEAGVEVATKRKKTPTYLGNEVLRGTITGRIVGLAVRQEEKKKAEEEGE
jgi:GTPase